MDSIKEEDKKDGFVTTAFTKEELTQLIEQEHGLFIAKEGDEVLAYVKRVTSLLKHTLTIPQKNNSKPFLT